MSEIRKILYIDDNLELSELVREYLSDKGMEVTLLHNSDHLIPELQKGTYELCLMDVMMPGKDGFELAEEMNVLSIQIPFLFLTGQTKKEDRIRGLKLGAQDYISKPFSLEELHLRILNILGRTTGTQNSRSTPAYRFDLGEHSFKADYGELIFRGETVKLSSTESKLLHYFCQHQNELITRSDILRHIWGEDDYYKGLSLNVYITRLRKQFRENPRIQILNEHGTGYKFMFE